MPLTRGDKLIIVGAVALAGAVVLGLAVLKRPQLFTGAPKPKPVAIAPAPAASPPTVPIPAPASPPPAPVAKPAPTAVAPAAPPAAPPPVAASSVTGSAAKPHPAGDASLEQMFEEISQEGKGGPSGGDRPAGPEREPTPAGSPEPQPAPAPAPAPASAPNPAVESAPADRSEAAAPQDAPKPQAASQAAKPAKSGKAAKHAAGKPQEQTAKSAAPAAVAAGSAAAGHVVRLVAEDKAGEFVLNVQTTKAPVHFRKQYMTDPPRMVLDLSGAWTYSGPLSRETGTGFIRRIRVGRHADMFRVVLDLAPDALSRFRGVPTAERVPGGVTLRIPK